MRTTAFGRLLDIAWRVLHSPRRCLTRMRGLTVQRARAIVSDVLHGATTASERLAERWSTHHGGTDTFSALVYWLAVPEITRRFQFLSTGGKSDHWVNYCVSFLGDRVPVERMASLGCGTGALERHLASLNAFRHCDGFDIAPTPLDVARRDAAAAGVSGIDYQLADIETLQLAKRAYDGIWFNGSLHHVSDLEGVCDRVAAALKPDGFVFVSEYVGANHFAFSERQKDAIRAAFALVPERYRRSFLDGGPGPVRSAPLIPDPREVAAVDPSEAVRSSDILRVVGERFEVVAHHDVGGTLLQFLLQGIAGNFRSDDPGSIAILEMLFRIEDALIAAGDLGSDFVLVVARPR
jgi:2-polyprenyl-3-methyl-5-hydroxy-6-metoxy-1,4-benzoquinol methylase